MMRLLVLCVVAACGGGVGVDAGPPMAELGTGELEFETIGDGDPMLVVHGPQGGYHLVGAMRASGIDPGNPNDLGDPSNPTTEFRVFRGQTRVDLMASRYTQGLNRNEDGVYEMIARRVILDIQDDAELDGVELRVEVEVTDVHGARATDARMVIGRPHPSNL
ncbi:MAG TPA: hypothetical protein VML75_14210 [Kofleriaceae bacterium]|nr:hypothetical protein [Kofleriaceae bacterium]